MKAVIKMARECGFDDREQDPMLLRFAELIRASEREACGKVRSAKPRKPKLTGFAALFEDPRYSFSKGWEEGAAAVRAAIQARGNK